MPDEYLQTAFEIKSACDEISRHLLRWHWEKKPGANSLGALLDHIALRTEESPDYYDRLPDLSGKTSWQQLDTTLCMRVLLDPEKDASRPLDLLGNTAHPAAARHACNAVRTARNEAAHAADRAGAAQAALLFNEAIEALEDGYANSAFSEYELSRYYRQAEGFLANFNKEEKPASVRPQEKPAPKAEGSSRRKPEAPADKPAAKTAAKSGAKTAAPKPRAASSPRNGKAKPNARSSANRGSFARGKRQSSNRRETNRALPVLLFLIVIAGLIVRAVSMRG